MNSQQRTKKALQGLSEHKNQSSEKDGSTPERDPRTKKTGDEPPFRGSYARNRVSCAVANSQLQSGIFDQISRSNSVFLLEGLKLGTSAFSASKA
jgi:hypothetical protein